MTVSDRSRRRRAPSPLDAEGLEKLALRYVERYATTRAKLRFYLLRKLRERGWDGGDPPRVDGIVDRFAGLGYVDDAAFAAARAASMQRRGYGERRIGQALAAAGIDPADRAPRDDQAAFSAALRFAQRKKIGPYALQKLEYAAREKAFAAMLRAGHSIDLARRIIDLPPGAVPDQEQI